MLGADVGTLITLGPIYALVLWRLAGRRIHLRSLALSAGAMVALVVAAALADLSRPAASRTHLGRFAEKVRDDGPGALWDTFARKQSANFRILGGSVWSDLLPIVAIFVLFLLVWERRGDELLPRGSALRIGFWSVLGAAALGFASNDSGPIVVSLFVAYLPPLLTAIALGLGAGQPPVLTVPEPAGDPSPPDRPPGRAEPVAAIS
jgi:hypothetical protein